MLVVSLTRSGALSQHQWTRATRPLFTTAAPVVGAQYCAPHGTTFTAIEMFLDGFPITDARGAMVMRAEKAPFSCPRRHLLLDISTASRRPVLTIKRSPRFFEIRRRWNVYSGNNTSQSDLPFVAVEPPLFKTGVVQVHLPGRGERDPDFVVHSRGFFGCDYNVYRAGAALAQINSGSAALLGLLFNMLAYRISVNPGVDHAFVVALTVILVEIRHDDEEERRRQQRAWNSR
ncbi:hypothetical protein ACQ4PT_002174 [Festuca glaucescens]